MVRQALQLVDSTSCLLCPVYGAGPVPAVSRRTVVRNAGWRRHNICYNRRMKQLSGKRVLLGVCGSIAAYKSAELVRDLRDAGAEVRVVMTEAATEFITPLTLQALSGHPVRTGLVDTAAEAAMGHIELARWPDAVLVAPASADFIARLAQGRADDLLAALCLATRAPVALAPAMNAGMWENAATRANIDKLTRQGVAFFGPVSGALACGEQGPGRMIDNRTIIDKLAALFPSAALQGVAVLVSAGPTREAIDPVRYLSNRSSGKMGFAVAAAAVEAGAQVTLISGPVALPTPERVKRVDVISAAQMYRAVMEHAPAHQIFVAAAAVADFVPQAFAQQKLKKEKFSAEDGFVLRLKQSPDILAELAGREQRPFLVGFAAETESVEQNGCAKLQRKKLDMIAINDVSEGRGFDRDENELLVLWPGGRARLELAGKGRLARELMGLIADRYREHYEKNTT